MRQLLGGAMARVLAVTLAIGTLAFPQGASAHAGCYRVLDGGRYYYYGDDHANSCSGTSGDDVFVMYGGDDYADGQGGDDWISLGGGNDSGYGRSGSDEIQGGTGADYIEGAVGPDDLFGHSGRDTIFGGSGPDLINLGRGDDIGYGDDSDDTIHGGEPDACAYGNDDAYGNGGADEFYDAGGGGHPSCTYMTNGDRDNFEGGSGIDYAHVHDEDGWDTLRLGSGNDVNCPYFDAFTSQGTGAQDDVIMQPDEGANDVFACGTLNQYGPLEGPVATAEEEAFGAVVPVEESLQDEIARRDSPPVPFLCSEDDESTCVHDPVADVIPNTDCYADIAPDDPLCQEPIEYSNALIANADDKRASEEAFAAYVTGAPAAMCRPFGGAAHGIRRTGHAPPTHIPMIDVAHWSAACAASAGPLAGNYTLALAVHFDYFDGSGWVHLDPETETTCTRPSNLGVAAIADCVSVHQYADGHESIGHLHRAHLSIASPVPDDLHFFSEPWLVVK